MVLTTYCVFERGLVFVTNQLANDRKHVVDSGMGPDTARVIFPEGHNSPHESLSGYTVVDELLESPGSESTVQRSRDGTVEVAEVGWDFETQHGLI